MDCKSNYTFSNKYISSLDMIYSEQNSRLMSNNYHMNFKNPTNNYMNMSYFNNNQTMTNLNNNPINNITNNINNNQSIYQNINQENKIVPEKYEEKYQNLNLREEFARIEDIRSKDPSLNQNLKPQDCFDLYGYPFLTHCDNYPFPQFNNAFKQKYLVKTLFDNKYIYINGKQYHRIMKRREVRKKINESIQINKNKMDKNKKYHHESRHRHAMNRERGKGGRFISKKKIEIENKNDNNEDKENEENDKENNVTLNDKEKEKEKK